MRACPNPARARRILLAGATGYIGRAVAVELLRRGHSVIAPVRDEGGRQRPDAAIVEDALAGVTRRVVELTDAALALLTPLAKLSPRFAAKAELARIGRYYATESMLLWDERKGEYDAEATPGYGEETLRDFYVRVLEEGLAGQLLGDQALF